jgi:hypothetical protein
LIRLAEWADGFTGDPWPLEAVRDAIGAVRLSEQAAADAEAPAWAQVLRGPADELRKEGEQLLMQRDGAALDTAAQKLRTALEPFKRLNQYLRTLQQTRQAADEATVLLPGHAAMAERDKTVLDDWLAAVRMALIVRRLTSEAAQLDVPKLPAAMRELESQTSELRDRLNRLARPFQSDRLKKLLVPAPRAGPPDLEDMDALLSGPLLSAGQRGELWKARCALAGRLHRETLAEDARDDKAGAMRPSAAALPNEDESRERVDDALRRARVSIGLLNLVRGKEVRSLEDAHALAAAHPADAAAWENLCRLLRQGWR